jgi:hypothetical protein
MEGMSKTILVVGAMASAMLVASMAALLTATPGVGKPQTVTLLGAGDIAGCDFKADRKTARLVGKIPGTIFTLGDNVYPEGTSEQYQNCYDPTWGTYKKRTRPSVGNHEYDTSSGAKPYFDYFGWRAGSPAEATTPTTWGPGTSWPSTATARRLVGVASAPPKGAGSAETSATTERGARWPTSTTRSMLPVEAMIAPR